MGQGLCSCVGTEGIEDDKEFDDERVIPFVERGYDIDSLSKIYPEAHYDLLVDSCRKYGRKGLSIAYIGGSLASLEESNVAKELVYKNLSCKKIVTYGRGGYGYSTVGYGFRDFLPLMKDYDVYILWSSTNDFTTGISGGKPTDYTKEDNYNIVHSTTQCGGINYMIHHIRMLHPKAKILAFTSLPFFGADNNRKEGNDSTATAPANQDCNFYQYVAKQKETLEYNGITYLDQFSIAPFTQQNYQAFYKEDGFHMKESGYFIVGCIQLRFLLNVLKNY